MSVYKQEGSDWSTETYTLQDHVNVHVHVHPQGVPLRACPN